MWAIRKEVNLSIGYTNTSAQVDTSIEVETKPRVQCYGARINIEALNTKPAIPMFDPDPFETNNEWPDASAKITDIRFTASEGDRHLEIIISGKDEMLIMAETFQYIAAQLREGAR